jgi:hypothetical protein
MKYDAMLTDTICSAAARQRKEDGSIELQTTPSFSVELMHMNPQQCISNGMLIENVIVGVYAYPRVGNKQGDCFHLLLFSKAILLSG